MYDCCMIFNEMDMLDIRFNVLDQVVDKFVIVESDRTHAGDPKELIFPQHKEQFSKFLHRIHYLIYNGAPREILINFWANENFQREKILDILQIDPPNDGLLYISDADEIPKPEKLVEAANLSRLAGRPVSLELYNCLYFMNYCAQEPYLGAFIYNPYLDILAPGRHEPASILRWHMSSSWKTDFPTISEAGWHFSSLGGLDKIREKLCAYAHQEFNKEEIASDEHLLTCIKEGIPFWEKLCIFNNEKLRFQKKEISFLPKYIQDNLEKFSQYILT